MVFDRVDCIALEVVSEDGAAIFGDASTDCVPIQAYESNLCGTRKQGGVAFRAVCALIVAAANHCLIHESRTNDGSALFGRLHISVFAEKPAQFAKAHRHAAGDTGGNYAQT